MLTTVSQFDLAVIGGGPAGASAAITAAGLGARVVLFEARDFPRHKVCGEFVSAEALGVLSGLLQGTPAIRPLFDTAPAINRTRMFWNGRMIETPMTPAALSITRHSLDVELWKAAEAAGVTSYSNCEVSRTEGDGPFRLTTTSGDFTAKALIIAAGRWSQFNRNRTLPPGPRWIGVKAHFRESNPTLSADLYFFENGYCGVQPVAADRVNACAMVRSDTASSLAQVFGLHGELARRAASWTQVTQTVSTAPLLYRPPHPGDGRTAFVGDAAAFIDPFVGDGISIALRSGQLVARCLRGFLLGETALDESIERYELEYHKQFTPLLSVASRVRTLFSLPMAAKVAAFAMLRVPGVIPFLIRRTRHAR